MKRISVAVLALFSLLVGTVPLVPAAVSSPLLAAQTLNPPVIASGVTTANFVANPITLGISEYTTTTKITATLSYPSATPSPADNVNACCFG